MVGSLPEWTAELMPCLDGPGMAAHYMGPLLDDQTAKEPYWYRYIPRYGGNGSWSIDLRPRYIGFRPVMDRWRNRRWPGFDVGPQSAKGDE